MKMRALNRGLTGKSFQSIYSEVDQDTLLQILSLEMNQRQIKAQDYHPDKA
jgi:hypothetical protein